MIKKIKKFFKVTLTPLTPSLKIDLDEQTVQSLKDGGEIIYSFQTRDIVFDEFLEIKISKRK